MERKLKAGLVFSALAALALVVATGMSRSGPARAQPTEPTGSKYVYAAKFICGVLRPVAGQKGETPVKPGNYATAINLHNPNNDPAPMIKKVVLALPEPAQGEPLGKHEFVLNPDGASEADCNEIYGLLQLKPSFKTFAKGFFVIESPVQLDVVGVYTASAPASANIGSSITEDIEYIQPHVIQQ